jgi:hypothetical protein
MNSLDELVKGYYDLLQSKAHEIGNWIEITTPYLDRHNDHIQVYLRPHGSGWSITDDGFTLADLAGYSVAPTTLQSILAEFGVQEIEESLEILTTEDSLPLSIHNLIQAILAITAVSTAAIQ